MGTPLPISVLDFSPMRDGETASDSLRRTVELARQADSLGYRRFWFTEHHNVPRLTNAAPAVVLAHIASVTRLIRVGSGGVMLPNHSPLVIAEQFGTLAGLHPGRIDLGIGRATGGPGADSEIFQMLRKPPDARGRFKRDLDELLALLGERRADDAPYVPARGLDVPVWLLGSSTSSAALAGKLGLPFSYASHIAPEDLQVALRAYRTNFRASRTLERDYAMVSAFIIAAETDAQAQDLLASIRPILLQWFRKTSVPRPPDNVTTPAAAATAEQDLPYAIVGSPETVRSGIEAVVRKTQADELIVITLIRDPVAASRSYEIVANVCGNITREPATSATG
ncbi:LLM class flavin-dependent oxidoreductase [Bradyrhizobium sp. Tv2a-2]|uniref:LLM class flavin-dependent oxidoreductase n=1 Tax=Bradyrhizobium sp. Tv2a-2 TaxID=113395 RepID=UPI0004095AFD|nr:LLM class flavin-dependent oxidoreductase [Bradyrhizobium sp. Tv2a-2]